MTDFIKADNTPSTTPLPTKLPFTSSVGIRSKEWRVCDNRMMQAIISDMCNLSVMQAQALSENRFLETDFVLKKEYFEYGIDNNVIMGFLKIATQEAMKITQNQLAYAQKGIAALTVDSRIDSDPTSWDMNHMALLGYYLEKNYQDELGNEYEFESSTATWSCVNNGKDYDMNIESGEPTLDRNSNEVIAGKYI
jgi:hypothetical protein